MNITTNFKQLWLWRNESQIYGWCEAVGLAIIVLVLLHVINPHNSLFINQGFPWPWIAPVIIVFQYGFGPSLLATILIASVAMVQKNQGHISIYDLQLFVTSGLALILICGLFSSKWVRRIQSAESLVEYTKGRLASLSASFYMLRVSNNYLEKNIITKPATLRVALEELQNANLFQPEVLSANIANSFLQILSQICMIDSLAIYLYQNKRLSITPLADVGNVGVLQIKDPLIKVCMETDEICYINMSQNILNSKCEYTITLPLITNDDLRVGILVIKEISFWSLNEEIIKTLGILVHFFMKNAIASKREKEILAVNPQCTIDFVRQLEILCSLKKTMDTDSALAAVLVSKTLRQHNVIDNLKNKCRTLDTCCVLEYDDHDILLTIMPFTNSSGLLGYLTRIKHYLNAELGLVIDNDLIKTRTIQVGENSVNTLNYFLNFIHGNTNE